jgi:hypothetical protein
VTQRTASLAYGFPAWRSVLGQLLLQPLLLLAEADDVCLAGIGLPWACIRGGSTGDVAELGGDDMHKDVGVLLEIEPAVAIVKPVCPSTVW